MTLRKPKAVRIQYKTFEMRSVCFSDGDSGNSEKSSVPNVIPMTGSCNDGVLNVHRTFPKMSDKEQTWLEDFLSIIAGFSTKRWRR